VGRGVELGSLSVAHPSLEDVYLDLVGGVADVGEEVTG